jgi:hypothetical protein
MRLNKYINEIKITRKFDLEKPTKKRYLDSFNRQVKIGKEKYEIDISPGLIGEYDIAFGIIGKPLDVLGTGNAFKVFAAVAQAIKEFLKIMDKKQEPVDMLMFSANIEHPSRIKLYDRFAKKFEKLFGFKLTNREDIGFDIEYEFTRVK